MITTHMHDRDNAREHARIMASYFDLPAVVIWTRQIAAGTRYCITPLLGQPHPKPVTWTPLETVRFPHA